MNSIIRLVAVAAGLILLVHVTPSWGQPVCATPGCNPTVSDANGNTAGGTGTLPSVVVSGPVESQAFRNTAFGQEALISNTGGINNTASGAFALTSNITGTNNTAIGASALRSSTTGSVNTATGLSALYSNTTGDGNTANGFTALFSNTTGSFNTASGGQALQFNTIGAGNTATGVAALLVNTTGNNNSASGAEALLLNGAGNLNTATGFQSLQNNADGNNNTAIGAKSLKKALGTKNIGIGFQAGVSLVNGNNNIYIGNQGAGDEFQTIRIGTAQEQTFIAGIVTAGVSGASVQVDGNGQLGVVPSSVRYKQDIIPMGASSNGVLDLRPVTFSYKEDAQKVKHYGLIAEEVATVYPDLVTRTASGEVQTVKYQELIPMLLNELQRQRHDFQQALRSQQQELAELRALVSQGREMAASVR